MSAVVWTGGCATRTVAPPVVVGADRYPDFVYPEIPAALASLPGGEPHALAWRWLQAGDPVTAAQVYGEVLDASPTFYPALVGLGLTDLAQGNQRRAVARFDEALRREGSYVPAMMGRGEALLALGDDLEALRSFEAAATADAGQGLARRRIEVLQLRVLQANLTAARAAAEDGRYAQASDAYRQAIAASPQSAFLYRELGSVERARGALEAALDEYQRAIAIDPRDADSWAQMGEVFESREDIGAAVEAYEEALRIDPSAPVTDRLSALQARLEFASLPEEYRRVGALRLVTRGDLAALLGVRLERWLAERSSRTAEVVTDTRGHWAAQYIFDVTRAGVMEAYANHTFQPAGAVRRVDLAQVVSRVLTLEGRRRPERLRDWEGREAPVVDVDRNNLNYPAVRLAVASGVMGLGDQGRFELQRPVDGAEAVRVVERLQQLVGSPPSSLGR